MAGIRAGGRGSEGLPGYSWLILLVMAPYLIHVLRSRPLLVALVLLFYAVFIVPMALKGQIPQVSFLWLPKAVAALLMTRSALHLGFFQWFWKFITRSFSTVLHGILDGVAFVTKIILMLLILPFSLVFGGFVPFLHHCYITFESFRVTSNQVVFFTLCEKLITPNTKLAALYFLLFYTVLAYLQKSLTTRPWSQMRTTNSTSLTDFLRLTSMYVAVRLGKGVAMSFVLVMFTLQFNHLEPNVTYIGITFIYFMITQRKWTGNERIIGWISSLELESLEQDEEFWVPFFFQIMPLITSVCLMAPLFMNHLVLCSVTIYTNVIVPAMLLYNQLEYHQFHSVSSAEAKESFRKATAKELEAHSTCPVCLEEMKVASVTPCKHLYHAACIRKCLAISPYCPMCKQVIA